MRPATAIRHADAAYRAVVASGAGLGRADIALILRRHHEEPQATLDYLRSRGFISATEVYVPRRAEPVVLYQACGPMEALEGEKQ